MSPIIVGLSGGVDSAVAALLLVEQGFQVQGLFMSNWDEQDVYCTQAQDYQDARAVARQLGIPLHRANFAADYQKRVFEYFLAEHRAGRTPNPDVLCNREVKFGGGAAPCAAPGRQPLRHRTLCPAAPCRRRGAAAQSSRCAQGSDLFPACRATRRSGAGAHAHRGVHQGSVCARRARAAGLPVFDKPDSTGICFIGERPFREFLRQYLDETPGRIESPSGEQLGTHCGLAFYTLGQRGGLGLGGRRDGEGSPGMWPPRMPRAMSSSPCRGHDHPLLMARELHCEPLHWLITPPTAARRCTVRVRHRHSDQPAVLYPAADGTARIVFDEPQWALTPRAVRGGL